MRSKKKISLHNLQYQIYIAYIFTLELIFKASDYLAKNFDDGDTESDGGLMKLVATLKHEPMCSPAVENKRDELLLTLIICFRRAKMLSRQSLPLSGSRHQRTF